MTLIDTLSATYLQSELLRNFDVSRRRYNYHRHRPANPNPEREALKAKIVDIHKASQGAA